MHSIPYPGTSQIGRFHAEYRNIFLGGYPRFGSSVEFQQIGATLGGVLTGSLDELLVLKQTLDGLRANARIRKQIERVFRYEDWEDKIADFFMKHSGTLGLATCFYCNIDYINSFENVEEYADIWDLLRNGSLEDLKTISGVGNVQAERIRRMVQTTQVTSFADLQLGKRAIDGIDKRRIQMEAGKPVDTRHMRNHFTLDHVIAKSKYPLFSLSLYNLVPCCNSCNSKFKSVKPLLNGNADPFLSPSSPAFAFDLSVRFSCYSRTASLPSPVREKDIVLRLKYFAREQTYRRYASLFRLAQRYVFHKGEVVDLINKSKRYSDHQLKEIAKLVGMPVENVKEDIFGKDIFQSGKPKSLTKLRKDIARDIGILK